MLGDLADAIGDGLYRQIGRVRSYTQQNRELPVDILEGPDGYLVVFDAAGARLDGVQVRYVGGTVRIRIDRVQEPRDGYEMRFPGRAASIDGAVDLPDDALVNPNDATAKVTENGTIRVEIPKDPEPAADDAQEPVSEEIAID